MKQALGLVLAAATVLMATTTATGAQAAVPDTPVYEPPRSPVRSSGR